MKHREIAAPARRAQLGLLADCRGLSTMEYTVLFVLILVGGLAIWSKLGNQMMSQVSQGSQSLGSTLGSFQHPGGNPNEPGAANSGNIVNPPCTTCGQQPATQPASPAAATAPSPGMKKQHSM